MKKIVAALFSLLILCACSTSVKETKEQYKKHNLTTRSISVENTPKESFVKNYKDGKIPLYSKEKFLVVYNQLIAAENPDMEITYTKSDIVNILNSPALIKEDGHYEVWQYRTNVCIINFIWNNSISKDKVFLIKSYNSEFIDYDYKKCIVVISNKNKLSEA